MARKRRRVASPPAPTPGAPSPVRQPYIAPLSAVTEVSVLGLRRILLEHEQGEFLRSALLAQYIERQADLAGALEQRLSGVMGLPFELEPADQSTNALGLCARVEDRWPLAFPRGVQRSMLKSRILLGFAVARVTTVYDGHQDELVPTLEPWHGSLIRFQPWDGTWWALTSDRGYERIVDESGAIAEGWVVHLAGSQRDAHLEGAVRSLGEPFLGAQYAARDSRRHSERLGQGILELLIPGLQGETDEVKRFKTAASRIGATGVIASPQYVQSAQDPSAQASFGIKLHFPPAEGLQGLLLLDAREVQRLRLRILGQDTTSVDAKGGGYARSQSGHDVRQDLTEGDALALGEIAEQLFDGWATFTGSSRGLFPEAEWCAEPPADKAAEATVRKDEGAALTSLVTALPALEEAAAKAGLALDVPALFERFGVPVKETKDDG